METTCEKCEIDYTTTQQWDDECYCFMCYHEIFGCPEWCEMKDSSCPGCLDCGDDCDVWNGNHLWTKMYRNNDYTGAYSQCEFCGLKIKEEENG